MNIFDTFKTYMGLAESSPGERAVTRTSSSSTSAPPSLGRVTLDSPEDIFMGSLNTFQMFSEDVYWKGHKLDTKEIERLPMSRILDLLADVSPDVSRAIWDALLFCNPGWEVDCYKPGTEDLDKDAKAKLMSFFTNLHGKYTVNHQVPLEVPIADLFAGAYLRGGMLMELLIDPKTKMPRELATPDPQTVKFRKVTDPVRGIVWEMGQWHSGQFYPVDRPTVWYVPVHQLWQPKGRAIYGPAIFTTLFLIGLLSDLRRVVQSQGYPRMDIELDYEKLRTSMPDDVKANSKKFAKWVDDIIGEVKKTYQKLKPDEAFIHPTYIKIGGSVGAVDSKSLGAMDGIIKALERMAMRGLKTMGILFGVNENTTETMANRQWEIHVAGIKAIQHFAEFIMERASETALRVQGVQATVKFRFAELRNSEFFRDAQVELLRTTNARAQYDNGSISADEMAKKSANKDKADATEPRNLLQHMGGTGATSLSTAMSGENRGLAETIQQQQIELIFRNFSLEEGPGGDFHKWWVTRLNNPFSWAEAYDRMLKAPPHVPRAN